MCKPHPIKNIKDKTNTMSLVYMMKKANNMQLHLWFFRDQLCTTHPHKAQSFVMLGRNDASAQHTKWPQMASYKLWPILNIVGL